VVLREDIGLLPCRVLAHQVAGTPSESSGA